MSQHHLALRVVRSLGPDSLALQQLMAAHRSHRDPAPAIAQAILEKAFLEDLSQAEVYRWICAMWPSSTAEEMTRAYRIASELFAVDYLMQDA